MSNNPTVDNSKVLVHLQTRKSDATTQQVFMAAGNGNASSLGSNNVTVTTDTNNHPLTSFQTIVQLNYPAIDDGVFRNLVGVDTTNQYISGDDDAFVIGGFYSEKHRQEILDRFQDPNQQTTFYLNGDPDVIEHILSIKDVDVDVSFPQGDVITLEQVATSQQIMSLNLADVAIVPQATSDEQDTINTISTGQDVMLMNDVTISIEPAYDSSNATDYDVWTNTSNGLSSSGSYNVTTDSYETDVLPLLSSTLVSLP